jgi:hypothetical protein
MTGSVAAEPGSAASELEYPVLRRGLLAVPVAAGLLVEGGSRRRLLKGSALAPVLPVLPRLLRLLDGAHDPAGVCAELGLDRAPLDEFLALLTECGALEPAGGIPTRSAGRGPAEHVTTYLSRMTHAAGGYRGGAELAAVLAGCAVLVVAPPPVAEQIAADLTESGIGSVPVAHAAAHVSADTLRAAAAAARRVAAVFDDGAASSGGDGLADAITRCHEHGLPVLRFACGPGHLEVGPAFFPGGHPACAGCFRRGYQAMAWHGPAAGDEPGQPPGHPLAADGVLASLVTTEVLALLTALTAPAPARTLVRLSVPWYHPERYDVTPEPGCACYGGAPAACSAAAAAAVYEWLEGSEPPELIERRATLTAAELRGLAKRLAERYAMTSGPRRTLPTSGPGGLSDPVAADMLRRVTGWRPAAEPGAAARLEPDDVTSVDLYLLTDGDLADLPATIFRYDGPARELAGVHADPVSLADALVSTDLDPPVLGFALVLVAGLGQARHRFGTLALRLSHLDAGCIAAQVAAVADGFGRRLHFASTWSRELADLLDLDPAREIVAAVVGVERAKEGPECR